MSKYLLKDGTPTTADDPQREIWYSATCGYWTDDWDKVSNGGIPACPICKSVGFIHSHTQFFGASFTDYDAANPGYAEWVTIETCHASKGGAHKSWEAFKRDYKKA